MSAGGLVVRLLGEWSLPEAAAACRGAGLALSDLPHDDAPDDARIALLVLTDRLPAPSLAELSEQDRRRALLVIPAELSTDARLFALGVGDILVWPADGAELVARIRLLLHRAAEHAALERRAARLEKRQEFIYERAPTMVHSIDRDGRVLSVSDAWLRTLGYTREEVLGRMSTDFLSEESARRSNELRGAFYEAGEIHGVDYEWVCKSGATLGTTLSAIVERDDGGNPRSFSVLNLDAGPKIQVRLDAASEDQVRLQSALRQANDTLDSVLNAIPDPLFVKDRAHRWILLNPAFCSFMGKSREELLGRSDFDFFPPKEAGVFWAKDELVFTTGVTHENEEAFTDSTGRCHTISTKKACFQRPNGEQILVGTIRDLTDRRTLESALRLNERMATVGTLAAGVAHEMNTPLAYILTNIEFAVDAIGKFRAGDEVDLDDLHASLRQSIEGAGRLRDVVQDLRRLSGPEEERRSAVSMRDVFEASARMLTNQIRQRGRLVIDVQADLPLVLGTSGRLGQVIVNLLLNAVQALPESGLRQNLVTLRAQREGAQHVLVEVTDNGTGIPDDVLPRIFDPFFTTKPIGVGTGLGLSLCHGIVTSFGGRIEALTSAAGTTMRIVLPVAKTALTVAPPSPPPPATGARGRILIIDDEPAMTIAIRRVLCADYDVTVAVGGEEGLRCVEAEDFDLVLCDLMMPVLTGAAIHDRLVSSKPELAARFVFMTGGAFTPDTQAFIARVSNRLVQKPFRSGELRQLARETVGGLVSAEKHSTKAPLAAPK